MYGFVFSFLIALVLYVSLSEQIDRQKKKIEILENKIEKYEQAELPKNTENE